MRYMYQTGRKAAGFILAAAVTLSSVTAAPSVYAEEPVPEEILYAGELSEGAGAETADGLPAEEFQEEEAVLQDEAGDMVVEDGEFTDLEEQTETGIMQDGTQDDAEDLPDGLIEELVPEEDALPDTVTETVELDMDVEDPFSPDSVADTSNDGFMLFAASAKASEPSSPFETSYGQQLTGMAAYFYNCLVEHYVNGRETGDWTVSCPAGNGGYDTHVDSLSSYKTSADWTGTKAMMKKDLQSCLNAFGYDYPEVFWERVYSTTWDISMEKDADGNGGTIHVESLNLKTKEAYTGSRNDIGAFFTAVGNAVAGLPQTCDYSGDGIITDAEYAKGAHDFAASALWYDSATLTKYRSNPTDSEAYRIFTPAPSFVESIGGGGVCEAYSRTVKVLLDRVGVTCCLLSGKDHMWNGIMIDGNWYLADATWDDSDTDTAGTAYLLSGADSKHPASGNITETGNELIFAVPAVSAEGYHEYGQWTVLEEATCVKNGSREHTCFLCGDTERETITVVPHVFTDWAVSREATCSRAGEKARTCTVCGRRETETIPVLEHSFGEWTVQKEASCTQGGTKTRTCSACGKTETQNIPATGHSFGEWATVKEASCTSDGTKERVCTACGERETQKIPATGHSYSSKAVEPTCTADGYTLHTCTYCGDTYKDSYVKAKGHGYVKDNAKSTAPTCTEDGEDVLVCSACGDVKKETVAKTGHSMGAWRTVFEATVFSAARQERSCAVCGNREDRTVGSALSPKISLNAYSIKLKTKQKTVKVKVSGLAKGDSVKAWSSSNTGIVTCGNGWIKAGKKTGTAYVTITTKAGASARITVKVQKKKVAVSGISVTSKTVSLKKGGTFDLKTVISPITADYPVKYTSSKKKTATVSKSGIIKGKNKGTCTVTVKCGKKKIKVKVRIS